MRTKTPPGGWGREGRGQGHKEQRPGSVLLSSTILGTLPGSGQSAVLSTAQMRTRGSERQLTSPAHRVQSQPWPALTGAACRRPGSELGGPVKACSVPMLKRCPSPALPKQGCSGMVRLWGARGTSAMVTLWAMGL